MANGIYMLDATGIRNTEIWTLRYSMVARGRQLSQKEREREKASSLSEDLRVKYFVQSNFGRVSDRICQFCATHACHGTSDLCTERKLLIQLKE